MQDNANKPTADILAEALGISTERAADLLHGRSLRDLVVNADALGLSPPKAARLLAAVELGARVFSEHERPEAIANPEDAARYLLAKYSMAPVEQFGYLALDVRHRLKGERIISTGTLTSSLVHPRELFRPLIVSRAAAAIIFHNHPSGDPTPSAEDVALTRRLVAAGMLLGIEILDHIILGAGRYASLKQGGTV